MSPKEASVGGLRDPSGGITLKEDSLSTNYENNTTTYDQKNVSNSIQHKFPRVEGCALRNSRHHQPHQYLHTTYRNTFAEERKKVLQHVEDSLPSVVQRMEGANMRIHGFTVAGQAANELLNSWGR